MMIACVLAAALAGQVVNVSNEDCEEAITIPNRGEWVCIYYQPAMWDASGTYVVPSGAPLEGADAEAWWPSFRYALPADGTTCLRVRCWVADEGRADSQGYIETGALAEFDSHAYMGVGLFPYAASQPVVDFFPFEQFGGRGSTPTTYQHRDGFSVVTSPPTDWLPGGGPTGTSAPLYAADDPDFHVQNLTFVNRWPEWWIFAGRSRVHPTTDVWYTPNDTGSTEFVYMKWRLQEWQTEAGGGGDLCCDEIVAAIVHMEGAVVEELQELNYDLDAWRASWLSQDGFLRETLAALAAVPEEGPTFTAPTTPSVTGADGSEVSTTYGPAFGETGFESLGVPVLDDEDAPTWSFALPAMAVGGMTVPAFSTSVDFADYPVIDTIRIGVSVVVMAFVFIWGHERVWDEFRRM